MPQLSLYLDDAAMDSLRSSAKSKGQSLSQYARDKICIPVASQWPQAFWQTYGLLADESFELPADERFDVGRPVPALDDLIAVGN